MKFLSTWLRNDGRTVSPRPPPGLLNEVPEHMAQECGIREARGRHHRPSSMKFLSTWLRNNVVSRRACCMTRSSMKFLSTWLRNGCRRRLWPPRSSLLNEVPEHMAQECERHQGHRHRQGLSSMKFLSTWLRNEAAHRQHLDQLHSSMKFLSTWLRNHGAWLSLGGTLVPQ